MANPYLTGSTPPAHPVFPPPVLTQRTVQLINSAFNTVAALPHAQHSVVDSVPTGGKSHDSDSDEELLAAAEAYDKQFATASSAQMPAGVGVGLASWLSGPPPSVRHPNGAVSLPPDAPDSVVESVPTGCTSHDCDSDEDLLAAAEVYEKQPATASAHMPAWAGHAAIWPTSVRAPCGVASCRVFWCPRRLPSVVAGGVCLWAGRADCRPASAESVA